MTSYQECKLNMYRSVELLCDNDSALIAANVAFGNAYAIFQSIEIVPPSFVYNDAC